VRAIRLSIPALATQLRSSLRGEYEFRTTRPNDRSPKANRRRRIRASVRHACATTWGVHASDPPAAEKFAENRPGTVPGRHVTNMTTPEPTVATPNNGLTSAEVKLRLVQFGPNAFAHEVRFAKLTQLLRTLADPMSLMLLMVGVVYLALGDTQDGVIVLVALLPVVGVDVFLDTRSNQALKKLNSALAPNARVIRDGQEREVPTRDLVPGDALVLREGMVIHADGVLRKAQNLAFDESQLTGESEPQNKLVASPGESADNTRFFAGSLVLAGQGLGEITETGAKTKFGAIAQLVRETTQAQTPLQKKIRTMFVRLALGAVAVGVIVFAVTVVRGQTWSQAFIGAVSFAMAAIPEEFPLVFALFLSLGAYRLSKRGVLVRRLASVETLGSTTVICTDKTGTLTTGVFALDEHAAFENKMSESQVLERACLACEPNPQDTMDQAIAAHCATHGVNLNVVQANWELVYDYDFDPHGKHMTHVWKNHTNHRYRIVSKGALEGVLEHCAATPAERAEVLAENEKLTKKGMRVLALAASDAASVANDRVENERGLVIVGLLGFHDPLRPEVPGAVAQCQAAGIAIKLITGDHALTAHAIAAQAGIANSETVLSGNELDGLSPQELARRVRGVAVFARTRPEQKFAIVEALRTAGEVVAMTGDGINDAPALRRADIGVSMGKRGTEVARAAADLVLLDDNFASLVSTVKEGRHIYNNIQAAFLYLLAFHVPIIGLSLLMPLIGLPLLMLPVHLIWLELVIHPVSALIFEAEPAAVDLMTTPPRKSTAPVLGGARMWRSLLTGTAITAAAAAAFALYQSKGADYARTMALSIVMVSGLLLIFAELAGTKPWWKLILPPASRFWPVWCAVLLSLLAAVFIGPVQRTLHFERLGLRDWGIVLAASLASVGWRITGLRSGTTGRALLVSEAIKTP